MTSRAHNTLFRHFNPPSKAAASFQWASFGTFPWDSIGKAIGFHASCLARWWHNPLDRLAVRADTCLTTPKNWGRETTSFCVTPAGFQVGGCGVL